MEFELWLFAVKQLAQTYEMSQVIFSQLPDAEKEDLRKEYDSTVGGGSSSSTDDKAEKADKIIKEYNDLLNGFQNAMSIAERFVEKNNVLKLNKKLQIDPSNPDQVFLRRSFTNLEASTQQVILFLKHISKPITAEGELHKDASGVYAVDGHKVGHGMLIEFFHINRWEIGRLCEVSDVPYGFFFLGFRNEVFDVDLEGLQVRLRE